MSKDTTSTPDRARSAEVACSPALAGMREKLLAAAREWDDARKSWKSQGNHAVAAVCNTAAFEFRELASQCQANARYLAPPPQMPENHE